jgi:tryptophanyl-tRNA synthetase
MFVYPVLMAADIADYDYVIVGEDQRPHIELAGDILPKIGKSCPQAIYSRKVMDLRHPDRKMSKSDPDSCLFISDSSEVIEHKIKKAVTTPDGRSNLEFIYITINGAHRITNKLRNTSNSELKDALTMSLLELWDK